MLTEDGFSGVYLYDRSNKAPFRRSSSVCELLEVVKKLENILFWGSILCVMFRVCPPEKVLSGAEYFENAVVLKF